MEEPEHPAGPPDFSPPSIGPENYQPADVDLRDTWLRLAPATRRARYAEAVRRLEAIRAVAGRPAAESERKAIARLVTWAHRSNVRRWQQGYRALGFQGLIKWRVAPPSGMPEEVKAAICTMRRVDPAVDVARIVEHVQQFHQFTTSETKIKRVLHAAGLSRPAGGRRGGGPWGERRLELGGLKLLEAAAVSTGYLESLTTGVVEYVRGLPEPATPRPPDTGDRDECGRFQAAYNERYRKGSADAVGPGFASVSVKRAGLSPERLQVRQVRPAVIEQKLLALWISPLLGGGRWDGIRVARGQLLEEVCGHGYMPATLDRFTRELKYAGVAPTLWEIHARQWLQLTAGWGDARRAAVLFVDATTKPLWTKLFSQSAPVSQRGKVMPALEVVAFHSGYGVPLWQATYSGRAPLVREVPALLAHLETVWGSDAVGRIVVIDAEGDSVPFLLGLEASGRSWVTRLPPSWVEGRAIFNWTNFRPYREGDRVRSGVADFKAPEGRTFRMRVVEIERRHRSDRTYLGASQKLRDQDWKPQALADLYFDRWPCEEANFRAVNQAVGFKEVHGYGKALVSNVSVVTGLETLAGQIQRAEQRQQEQQAKLDALQQRQRQEEQTLLRRKRHQETVARRAQQRAVAGRPVTSSLQALVTEQGELAQEVVARTEQVTALRQQVQKAQGLTERTSERLTRYHEQRQRLEGRRHIFAHDVELDSLFSLLKVGLVLLVTYVLRNYLGQAKMEPSTFLERVATLPARLRQTPKHEIVTFEYNHRDPEVMGLLAGCVEAINALQLPLRSGKRLRVAVDPAPPPRRAPPPGSRTGSGDRYH